MSTINQRIKSLINIKEKSHTALAKRLKVSPQYISQLVTDGKSVGLDAVKYLLSQYPDLNINWLITGEGEMLKKESSSLVMEPPEHYIKLIKTQEKLIEKLEHELETERKSRGCSNNRKQAG